MIGPPSTAKAPAKQSEESSREALIGGGDLIDVSVYGASDFAKQVRVSASGDISLPLIGSVHVADLSASDAEALIARKLSEGKFFNEPRVAVFIREYATQGVSVMGEVVKPGVYPILGARQLFDVISLAGGVTLKAGNTVTVTHRGGKEPPIQVTLAADASKSVESNIPIYPGDTVVVSKAGIVYVVGDVKTPGGFVLDNVSDMTVLKAIALAQGTNQTASLGSAKLVRKTTVGQTEVPLPLDKIMSSKAQDVVVHADDIIFVPRSAAKGAAMRGLDAIIQTATGIAIYRR